MHRVWYCDLDMMPDELHQENVVFDDGHLWRDMLPDELHGA